MSEPGAVWNAETGGTVDRSQGVARASRRGEWGRRRWVDVGGRERAPKVEMRDARAELFCGCGRLVVIGEWNGVEWCECGQCYRLSCAVKMEVFDE